MSEEKVEGGRVKDEKAAKGIMFRGQFIKWDNPLQTHTAWFNERTGEFIGIELDQIEREVAG